MNAIESYKNLCVTIDINKNLIENYQDQQRYYRKLLEARKPKDIKAQQYDDMPKGSQNALGMKEILDIIEELDNHIYILEQALEKAEEGRIETEEGLNKLEGLEAEVYKMHVLEGMSLKEVANRLEYAYDYIRTISSRMNTQLSHRHID